MKVVLAAVAACLGAVGPALAEPPPASAFGRIPAVVQAAISPNGQHVAVLGGISDQRALSIATLDQPNAPIVSLGRVEAVGVRWIGDDYVLARVAVFEQVGPRAAYRIERNMAIDLQGKVVSRLLGHEDVSSFLTEQPVLAVTSANPRRAIVQGLSLSNEVGTGWDSHVPRKGADNPFTASLFRVDPATGNGDVIEKGNAATRGWDVDLSGQARVRIDYDDVNNRVVIMGRPKGSSQYVKVWDADDFEDARNYYGYSDAEDAIYYLDGDNLVRKRLADGVVEPVPQSAGAVAPRLIWDDARQSPVGVTAGAEKPSVNWIDPDLGAVHTALSRVFKDQRVDLEAWSDDRSRVVVRTSAPAHPPAWYLFDRPRKELSPLGDEYPELKGAVLGTTRWITYKAADGLEIPAYVTLPPGAPAEGGKLPLVVMPHGGPTVRDDYDFDFMAQFLATRGYVVLQPEFRGSWGFGQAFEYAGRGEWGGKMQTDLLDGVAALAASGTIDPARVCIFGASFGGYAALAGAALHPEAYRCAASFAGISDLGLMIVEEGRLYGRDSLGVRELRRVLGKASIFKLNATSPDKHADAIKAPILLMHGDKDTVVPPEQSEKMAAALKDAGKPVEYLVLKDENHYLTHSDTRTQMLEALGAFLAKNLPVAR